MAVNYNCDYFIYDDNRCRCCDYVEFITPENTKGNELHPQKLYEIKHI